MPTIRLGTAGTRAGGGRVRAAALAVLLTAASVSTAAAQQIRGLLRADTGEAIAGAIVWLLQDGERIGRTLTATGGGFVLDVPRPGAYTLVVERIGFAAEESGPIDVPPGGVSGHLLTVRPRAVELDGIVVEADRRCGRRDGSPEVHRVWEEARKALEAVAVADRRGLVRYVVLSHDRELDARTLAVRREGRTARSVVTRVPVRSRPADDLAEGGYVRSTRDGIEYYAPDAEILLSDRFAETHCFTLTADPVRADRIGLAFEPLEADGLPDVSGVLWLDRASAELRELEFRYVRLPWRLDDVRIGGRLSFERAPGGPWIVRDWWIRMPLLGTAVRPAGRGHEVRITGFRQTGAEVIDHAPTLAARLDEWERAADTPAATVAGTRPEPTDTAIRAAEAGATDTVFALPAIAVEGTRRSPALARAGFYERQATSRGRFLEREDIREMSVGRPSEIFERLPGIRTRPLRQGVGMAVWMAGSERPGTGGIGICGPRLLVNGVEAYEGGHRGPLEIDAYVNLHDITAVEVYRGAAELPAQYGGAHGACGVISIWTVE